MFEIYLEKGILFERVMQASMVCPIAFSNGIIKVGGNIELGMQYQNYTLPDIEHAINKAYEVSAREKARREEVV